MLTLIQEEMGVLYFIVVIIVFFLFLFSFLFVFVSVFISQASSQISFNPEVWPCVIWLHDHHKV